MKPLTTYHLPLTTYHLPLTTYHLPLSTRLSRLFSCAFLVVFLLLQFNSEAQTPFITEYTHSQIQAAGMTTKFTALSNHAFNKSVQVVSIGNVNNYASNGKISFLLPGLDTLKAESYMVTEGQNELLWSANLTNMPGYIALVYKNNLISGFLQAGKRYYEIIPFDATHQFLLRRDNSLTKGCVPPGTPASPTDPPPPGPGDDACTYPSEHNAYQTCPAVISVLLVVTPEAKAWIDAQYGSMDIISVLGKASVNAAFYRSDIPNKEIRIKWIEKIVNLDPGLDPKNDADNLPLLIKAERNAEQADVAFLITNQGYDNVGGIVTDIGPNFDKAFGIVEIPYFLSQFVFAHELGHLLGCRHTWPYDLESFSDNTSTCAHAYRWYDIPADAVYDDENFQYNVDSWTTLMGTQVGHGFVLQLQRPEGKVYVKVNEGDSRILNYSNPEVNYTITEKTGRSAGYITNNARYIRNSACTVAEFFPTKELGVSITYPRAPYDCNLPFPLTANITEPAAGLPGIPPYTLTWYWGESGLFYPPLLPFYYLGQDETIYLNQFPAPVFWVRCEVTSADNMVVSKIVRFDKSGCSGFMPGGSEDRTNMFTAIPSATAKVFPNPISIDLLQLNLPEYNAQEVSVKVFDLYGRMVQERLLNFDESGNSTLEIAGLPSGAYYLHCQPKTEAAQNFSFVILQN